MITTGLTALGVIFLLGFIVQSFTEYAFGTWLKGTVMRFVNLAVGVLVAIGFNVRLIEALTGYVSPIPYADVILSGLCIAQGSDFLHSLQKIAQQFAQGLFTTSVSATPTTPVTPGTNPLK